MQITRQIIFHAGHMLADDDSKCHHPHGHEYVFQCTIKGDLQTAGTEAGMVLNFGTLKGMMMELIHNRFDHKFILDPADPRANGFVRLFEPAGFYLMPKHSPPTAENLVDLIWIIMQNNLPLHTKLVKVKLQETSNCWAEKIIYEN